MPIAARWRLLSRLPPTRGRDPLPGVYELADANRRVIYIGMSATDVPSRLKQHLSRPGPVRDRAVYWRQEASRVPAAREAQLLAEFSAKHGRLPELNRAEPLERDASRRYRELSSSRD